MKRVIGTEAGELYKAGKLKLEPPKPMEKKSALQAKLNQNELNKTVLPPIVTRWVFLKKREPPRRGVGVTL